MCEPTDEPSFTARQALCWGAWLHAGGKRRQLLVQHLVAGVGLGQGHALLVKLARPLFVVGALEQFAEGVATAADDAQSPPPATVTMEQLSAVLPAPLTHFLAAHVPRRKQYALPAVFAPVLFHSSELSLFIYLSFPLFLPSPRSPASSSLLLRA